MSKIPKGKEGAGYPWILLLKISEEELAEDLLAASTVSPIFLKHQWYFDSVYQNYQQ